MWKVTVWMTTTHWIMRPSGRGSSRHVHTGSRPSSRSWRWRAPRSWPYLLIISFLQIGEEQQLNVSLKAMKSPRHITKIAKKSDSHFQDLKRNQAKIMILPEFKLLDKNSRKFSIKLAIKMQQITFIALICRDHCHKKYTLAVYNINKKTQMIWSMMTLHHRKK